MTPRGTDWGLAGLVGLGVASGVLSLFGGAPGDGWVLAGHGVAGAALALVLVPKLRRVGARLVRPRRWDRRTGAGVVATGLVLATLLSGWMWSSGADLRVAGYGLLNWHFAIGAGLGVLVLTHALLRAKPLRVRDLRSRRQFLQAAAVLGVSFVAWELQRPVSGLFGWRGVRRRFTGSYEEASLAGNAFPATSWVADRPRPLDPAAYVLEVTGLVARPARFALRRLDAGDALEAVLDCTGGFFSRQRWRGVRIGRVLDRAGIAAAASHVTVVSRTGYRWSFGLPEARGLLLATHVGDELLSHEHGAPLRLVAPGRRGFQWVKWVVRIEVRDSPDLGAPASTVWSSFTAAGRGEA